MNYTQLTDEQLNAQYDYAKQVAETAEAEMEAIGAEQIARREKAKAEAWHAVVQAITYFTKEFGRIDIDPGAVDTIWPHGMDFSKPGFIGTSR